MSELPTVPIKHVLRSHANAVISVSALLLGFAVIAVGLRFYTRTFLIRNVGYDDVMALASLVCND
jgi:hypothetical protein